jgi:hypothetical protein
MSGDFIRHLDVGVRAQRPAFTEEMLSTWRDYQSALHRGGVDSDEVKQLDWQLWCQLGLAPGVDKFPARRSISRPTPNRRCGLRC